MLYIHLSFLLNIQVNVVSSALWEKLHIVLQINAWKYIYSHVQKFIIS